MKRIKFAYKDSFTKDTWRVQLCTVSSLEECKKIYGLGIDCKYKIISVEDVED